MRPAGHIKSGVHHSHGDCSGRPWGHGRFCSRQVIFRCLCAMPVTQAHQEHDILPRRGLRMPALYTLVRPGTIRRLGSQVTAGLRGFRPGAGGSCHPDSLCLLSATDMQGTAMQVHLKVWSTSWGSTAMPGMMTGSSLRRKFLASSRSTDDVCQKLMTDCLCNNTKPGARLSHQSWRL